MDDRQFDELTRAVARGTSRRGLLRSLVAIVAGGLAGARLAEDATARRASRQADGMPCTKATDCISLTCADGVCCDTPCLGQCESCVSGACTPVVGAPVGGRPSCPGSGPCTASCDGINGQTCAAWPGSDTLCGVATCFDGWLTTSACGGNGSCVPTTTSCAPYGCDANGAACASGCTSHDQCPGSSHCAGGVCVGDKGLGSACVDGAECQHGICANRVCCAESCDGPCQVCGADGFCGPAPDDTPCAGGRCCDGACIDDRTDVAHCGGCHRSCAGDVCQRAICAGGICDTAPLPDGSQCDDGNACTGPDTCQGGVCTGPAIVCPDPDQCHEPGACDPETGDCVYPAKRDGTDCNDNNACTEFDTCQEGVCTGPLISCDDGLSCTTDTCDPATGCINTLQSGFCLIATTCYSAGTRNPANPCQICDPIAALEAWSDAPVGFACDDATRCNGREACNGSGTCELGIPVVCPNPLPCQEAGICNTETGECQYALKVGTVCRTAANSCEQDAVCTGTDPDCPANPAVVCPDDALSCTTTTCDPATGCGHTLQDDACLIEGVCYPAGRHPDGLASCLFCRTIYGNDRSWVPLGGLPCDDGLACTEHDTCRQDGACVGTPKVCAEDDGLACTESVCDPETGQCVQHLTTGWCFIDGACVAEGDRNPANDCQHCDPASSQTAWSFVPFGGVCNDGAACTTTVCDGAGACQANGPRDCTAEATPCQRSLGCDPALGCIFETLSGETSCGFGDSLRCCGSVCVDLATDPNNCHSCGGTCGVEQGEFCVNGRCVCGEEFCFGEMTGPDGAIIFSSVCCDRHCIDRMNDPNNCGACGHVCPGGHHCCGGTCIDVRNDLDNCGVCGHVCPTPAPELGTAICSEGVCGEVCNGSNHAISCDGVCVDSFTDPGNCGFCGVSCVDNPTGDTCAFGECRCGPSFTSPFCRTDLGEYCCSGACRDILNEIDNCGACDNDCPPVCDNVGLCDFGRCCDGVCTAFNTLDNCGACGRACPSWASQCRPDHECYCGNSQCEQGQGCCHINNDPARLKDCTNIAGDVNNCGACGNVCPTGASCVDGECVCPTGQAACDGACIDIKTDRANCGACGNECRIVTPSELILPGECCDGVCTDTLTDPDNCGICGNSCNGPLQTGNCIAGGCQVAACPPNRANCDGDLANGCEVDLLSDPNNCGACGNACNCAGAVCTNGTCCVATGESCEACHELNIGCCNGAICLDPRFQNTSC